MKSEFLESELEMYVQRLLVHEFYSSGNHYRMLKISPSEERLKGYDAKIIGLTPFYCQFKTSDFVRQGSLFKSRSTYLKSKKWPISPFYSFALRIPNDSHDKKNPEVWQHNVLHSLWRSNPSAVAYVAPVYHTRIEMDLLEPVSIGVCCILGDRHVHHSRITIREVALNGNEKCRLPFFDGLISIPPHTSVTDLKHSYAFTSHRDITFHSDPEQVEGGKPFGEALEQFVRKSLAVGQNKIGLERIQDMLGTLGQDADFISPFLSYGLVQAGVDAKDIGADVKTYWHEAGWLQQNIALAASLYAYFGISTFGLVKVKEQ